MASDRQPSPRSSRRSIPLSSSTRQLRRSVRRTTLAAAAATGLVLSLAAAPAFSAYEPGIPPEVDPGTPTYAGASEPVPAEGVSYDPRRSMLEEIYEEDRDDGGDSYWFDRVLERGAGLSSGDHLYTRGRALYMNNHNEDVLGFAGGYAYRERPTDSDQDLYSVAISDATLAEVEAERRQYPSHWSSVHEGGGSASSSGSSSPSTTSPSPS